VQQTPVSWTRHTTGSLSHFWREKVSINLSNNLVSISLYTAMS